MQGTAGEPAADSPLNAPGVDVRPGDRLLAVNGRRVTGATLPQELLVHQAGEEVVLTVRRGEEAPRVVTVRARRSEALARYREWVEANRRKVHEATDGRVGYVHIPDMGPRGFAEFHRVYLTEVERDGLVVDVRYNRGGHVSQLLLEKLARRRVGYDVSRWGKPEPYPLDSRAGPMVALTNEWAGSDGDIFSHVFKLMKLGPLIGKRTWGGVIGIWPRHVLADGTVTTQPEFSFWFDDVAGAWRTTAPTRTSRSTSRRRTTRRAATRSSTGPSPRCCACWRRTRPPSRRSTSARSSPRPRSSPDLPLNGLRGPRGPPHPLRSRKHRPHACGGACCRAGSSQRDEPQPFPEHLRDTTRAFYKLFYQVDLREHQLDTLLSPATSSKREK